MGGDGGSITQRVDMVKTKGYGFSRKSCIGGMGYGPNHIGRVDDETMDPKVLRALQLKNCALSQQPLEKPIVCCRLGKLYNKPAVIRRLLDKDMPESFAHIGSLKDVKECRIAYTTGESGSFICPITSRNLSDGVSRSVVIWKCGCMLSSKAISSVGACGDQCLSCGDSVDYKTDLIVKVLPDSAEVEEIQKRLAEERASKKPKKAAETKPSTKRKEASQSVSARSAEARKEHLDEVLKKYKDSGAYTKIFHNPATPVVTDAFGRSYSNKGVGV